MLSDLAERGMKIDSLLVGSFIIAHVGSRFLSASFEIAHSKADSYQPAANMVAKLWSNLPAENIVLFEHITWWFALGLILLFLPYFPYSKHAHLFMGPINIMAKEKRKSMASIEKIDFEDLMTVSDEGTLVNFMVRKEGKNITNILVIIHGNSDFILLSLEGNLNLEDLKQLDFDIKGGYIFKNLPSDKA